MVISEIRALFGRGIRLYHGLIGIGARVAGCTTR